MSPLYDPGLWQFPSIWQATITATGVTSEARHSLIEQTLQSTAQGGTASRKARARSMPRTGGRLSHSSAPSSFPFFGLPGEVRNRIYSEMFAGSWFALDLVQRPCEGTFSRPPFFSLSLSQQARLLGINERKIIQIFPREPTHLFHEAYVLRHNGYLDLASINKQFRYEAMPVLLRTSIFASVVQAPVQLGQFIPQAWRIHVTRVVFPLPMKVVPSLGYLGRLERIHWTFDATHKFSEGGTLTLASFLSKTDETLAAVALQVPDGSNNSNQVVLTHVKLYPELEWIVTARVRVSADLEENRRNRYNLSLSARYDLIINAKTHTMKKYFRGLHGRIFNTEQSHTFFPDYCSYRVRMTPRLLEKYDPWHSWDGECLKWDIVRGFVLGTVNLQLDEVTDAESLRIQRLKIIPQLVFLLAAIALVLLAFSAGETDTRMHPCRGLS
ncbi:uncharacterized protein AB675_12143 [Cyphellophora attinorum]|uniref:F-box domain-containing protein n=1 Tax=Cyphellophora attinorum TaxID=1664694 RepID=A0A0N1H1W4_9EURO|nr:uncharacterized protein AB675_12143 [Phialophora attinorum]KPI38255.1 hypothetical protein AB675_12143 [Phialophora attinorum]